MSALLRNEMENPLLSSIVFNALKGALPRLLTKVPMKSPESA
jgi:hypothetical protein